MVEVQQRMKIKRTERKENDSCFLFPTPFPQKLPREAILGRNIVNTRKCVNIDEVSMTRENRESKSSREEQTKEVDDV